MITVLVTGSNGQLGMCLQDVATNSSSIRWIFKSSKELDITDEVSVTNAFNNNQIDYLVNCAAYTAVDKAESEPEKAFLVNAEGVRILAKMCKVYDIVLIHISTDFVFDGKKKTPYLEADLPNPINVYGASKLKGERYVQELLDKHYIIRTSWVYSKYGNSFVKTMLRLADEKDEISVVDDQIGSPTYAGDLADAICNIITKERSIHKMHEPVPIYGTYHYSSKGKCSWYDFAKQIFKINNINIRLHPISTRDYQTSATRPLYSYLDKSKISKTFGLKIKDWVNHPAIRI